ncbi:hypothetical protein [Streptomyces liliifuscus]|uniref:Uncharacterized protein n=1 Tax=Streptomyces liliifuscus TaxID=2797636 RepID=A0A7T7I6M5_9ACTN|nr:hypothetical protein [Streptomyces liliifuscus]QQM41994.1 hypothetical protein JEQ17_22805 [Streptomyces liliifuscus]
MTTRPALGTLAATTAGDSDEYDRERLLAQYHRERARRALVLDSIRAHLDEQPSPRAVRASARRWVADLLAIAEKVAKNKMEHPE